MKNAMWYLGFLSLLSLLFLVEGKPAFLCSLGFLSYFSLYRENDEMLEMFVGKAARNAFMYTMFSGAAFLAYIYLTGNTGLLGAALALLYGGSLLVCILSLFYYIRMGNR
ncbi:MAG: DUF3796 domain-containing protein [Theionarchaea archaeon]|nr:DUF3796 domain-containing protein [Theionarchaea archaeon]MBU6999831.1 DUF3796 domain-containing protein [Theionarchaea archaeon]MBU7021942.1 DUF3796 domain-containing protein [Theionarchaea archaeon]MBU7035217.1 DUF3796 domain-containing protein [Theionarchaea archaeon]MBU7040710.1 DUF3796 domain-containing protein [Theionarchaea archaeon]